MIGFHEILFPLDVGFGATGGPERRTDIALLSSGFEERNARWASSRRHYDAGLGVRSAKDLARVLSFFEERRGRLYGFRFRDPLDHASCGLGETPTHHDQTLGLGDGSTAAFQLVKTYGRDHEPFERRISKPVFGSVKVAIDGVETSTYALDVSNGQIVFDVAPASGSEVTAGYLFDVPVRFDTDHLEFSLTAFEAGDIPSIPLKEIRT